MLTLVGNLALRCGRLLMVVNMALITTKHVDFQHDAVDFQRGADGHPSRDADSGIDEVPRQQSAATAEQLASISD